MFILCKAHTCRRVKMGEDIKLKYEMRGATCPGKGGGALFLFIILSSALEKIPPKSRIKDILRHKFTPFDRWKMQSLRKNPVP